MSDSLALLLESVYSLENFIYLDPITDFLALSIVRKKIAESKLEICNTISIKQLTSMVLESDGNVIIKLPDGKNLVISKDFIEWFRGFTDGEGSFGFRHLSCNSFG